MIHRFSAYVFGKADKDEDMLRVGYVMEQRTLVREQLQPYLMPTTEIVDVLRD